LHIFLIAHPKKMQTKEGQPDVPTLYDISGSAHFYNKTDNGITVYRNAGDGVEIFIQKIRFQEYVGKPSFKPCVFVYERNTRVYKENEVLTNTDFEF
jgi:twinkle protein